MRRVDPIETGPGSHSYCISRSLSDNNSTWHIRYHVQTIFSRPLQLYPGPMGPPTTIPTQLHLIHSPPIYTNLTLLTTTIWSHAEPC